MNLPIKVTTRRTPESRLILDITIGARSSIALTVREANELIEKLEEKL